YDSKANPMHRKMFTHAKAAPNASASPVRLWELFVSSAQASSTISKYLDWRSPRRTPYSCDPALGARSRTQIEPARTSQNFILEQKILKLFRPNLERRDMNGQK